MLKSDRQGLCSLCLTYSVSIASSATDYAIILEFHVFYFSVRARLCFAVSSPIAILGQGRHFSFSQGEQIPKMEI